MSRYSHTIASGGTAQTLAVAQPYYLKKVPGNPFLGCVHDGSSTGYMEGFSLKKIHWLYRWRHNHWPGKSVGRWSRNVHGKDVHWLEVSSIEKFRLRCTDEESTGMAFIFWVTVAYTIYHCFRLLYYHPDLTMYNVALYTSKPWIMPFRANAKHVLAQPILRYHQRVPEFYCDDPIRQMYQLGMFANDPVMERAKLANKVHLLTAPRASGANIFNVGLFDDVEKGRNLYTLVH